tara:strand:- start:87 stop:1535 length:1449 start_codon:yes stop_codon:yes gene_type:complete
MKKKISLVIGTFNVLHAGHIRLLKYAKEISDYLIVAVNSDKNDSSKSLVKQKLRLENLKSLDWVNKSFIWDKSIYELIKKYRPTYVVKGKEHQNKFNLEKDIVKKYKGKLIFGSDQFSFSSLDLIDQELNRFENEKINLPSQYLKRHKIKTIKLKQFPKEIKNLNVAILGDLIVDEYINCEALGMSREQPSIVAKPLESFKFIGGAGIAASHVSSLGANAYLFSMTGNDKLKKFVTTELKKNKVNFYNFSTNSRPTSLKKRFMNNNNSIFRLNILRQLEIDEQQQNKIFYKLKKIIKKLDLIIFSDFNYGFLPQKLVDRVIKMARENKTYLVADSQSSSQIGDIARFKNVNLITPTEHEARVSLKNYDDGLVVISEKLRKITNSDHLILTLGKDGLFIQTKNNKKNIKQSFETEKISTLIKEAKDTAGAGDALLVSTSLALASRKYNIYEASLLGAVASAIQVSKIGNIPLQNAEIQRFLKY